MNLALDIAVTIVSWTIVGLQVWATKAHFVADRVERPAVLLALLVMLTALVYTALLWTNAQPELAKLIGFCIELGALVLFCAAIFASRQAQLRFAFDQSNPRSLLQEGPYKFVRHPFYTSYIVFWIGWAIATWSPLSLVPFALLLAFYIMAARGEERRFASTAMAADYQAYRQRAGLFWPRLVKH